MEVVCDGNCDEQIVLAVHGGCDELTRATVLQVRSRAGVMQHCSRLVELVVFAGLVAELLH